MEYLLAIVSGLIQGVTEFLPVSSSGHLVIFHEMFNFNLSDELFFDLVLHFGTLVALLLLFYRDIEKIIRGFFSSLFNWNWSNNFNQRLAWLVIIATIPAAVIGYFFENIIEQYFRSAIWVAVMLIVVAVFFWIFEKRYSNGSKNVQSVGWLDALVIGVAQILAFIPGTSRSGITIIAGLGRKLKRDEAARFSFLISIPIVFGAVLKKFIFLGPVTQYEPLLILLGFLSASISGYFSARFLIKYLSRYSLNIFAWYRLIIGCLILIWFFLS